MEKKRRVAVVVTVGLSRLAQSQALKVAQEEFPNEIVEVIDESKAHMIRTKELVFEVKNIHKDVPLFTDRFYDAPKEKRHTATLMKKGGKKQKNRYPNQRR